MWKNYGIYINQAYSLLLKKRKIIRLNAEFRGIKKRKTRYIESMMIESVYTPIILDIEDFSIMCSIKFQVIPTVSLVACPSFVAVDNFLIF